MESPPSAAGTKLEFLPSANHEDHDSDDHSCDEQPSDNTSKKTSGKRMYSYHCSDVTSSPLPDSFARKVFFCHESIFPSCTSSDDDNTKKSVVAGGTFPSNLRFIRLPHPRHQHMVIFLEDTTAGKLFEVQHATMPFIHGTWFMLERGGGTDGFIEPKSPLHLVTPFDEAFFTLLVASRCSTSLQAAADSDVEEKFMSAEDMMRSARDGCGFHRGPQQTESLHCLRRLLTTISPATTDKIAAQLYHFCEEKKVGLDSYFRFSMNKSLSWIEKKIHHLWSSSESLRSLCVGTTNVVSAEDDVLVHERAFTLVAEYVDGALLRATTTAELRSLSGLAATPNTTLRTTTAMDYCRGKANVEDDAFFRVKASEATIQKKSRTESMTKSLSVRRSEKAGPPKNTPTLTSMFAKKKQEMKPEPLKENIPPS